VKYYIFIAVIHLMAAKEITDYYVFVLRSLAEGQIRFILQFNCFLRFREYCLFPFKLFAPCFIYASSQSFHLLRFLFLFTSLHFTMAFKTHYSDFDQAIKFEIHFTILKGYFELAKLPKNYLIWFL